MIRGLHHIVLFCNDTEEAKTWFERAGFEYKRGYEGMHWFTLDDAEIMLHPAQSIGREHTSTVHLAVADLDALFAKVRAEGLRPFDHQDPDKELEAPVVRPWNDRAFELQDPDGRVWAFTEVSGQS